MVFFWHLLRSTVHHVKKGREGTERGTEGGRHAASSMRLKQVCCLRSESKTKATLDALENLPHST